MMLGVVPAAGFGQAPLVLGFSAGLVAAFNPCGFAMLPAYLAYFVRGEDEDRHLFRAMAVAGVVSAGFVLVFGIAGLLAVKFSLAVARFGKWFTVIIGAAMIPVGFAMLRGYKPAINLPRFQRGGRDRGLASMFAFGVSYATVSLGCTLPIFIISVAGVFQTTSFASGMAVFGAYTLGMSLVMAALTVALALARQGLVNRLKGAMRHVNTASGVLLMVAGVYITYYGIYTFRIERGRTAGGGPVSFVSGLSGRASQFVSDHGAVRIGLVLGGAVVALVLARWIRRRPVGTPSGER